jgi:hypothetical protein
VPSGKQEDTYDANDNLTLRVIYNWNSEVSAFITNYEAKSTYDEYGRRTLRIDLRYVWNSDTSALLPTSKEEYIFDTNDRGFILILYVWNAETSTFVPTSKKEYTNDGDGKQTSYILYTWNSEIGIFYPTEKIEFDFDDQKRVVEEKSYTFDICDNSKELIKKAEYYYIDGLSGRNIKFYIVHQGVFQFYYETAYFYDSNNRLVLRYQNVNPAIFGQNSLAYYNYKIEYEYDEEGNQTLLIRYNWDAASASLVANFKLESTYDEDSNLQQELYYKWYAGLGVYKPSFKKEYDIIVEIGRAHV